MSPATALDLYLGEPSAPGVSRRRVIPGAPADLCLLAAPLTVVLAQPASEAVAATVIGGRVVYSRRPR